MFEFTLYGDYKHFQTHSNKYSGFKLYVHYDTNFIAARYIHNNKYYDEYTNAYYLCHYTLHVYHNLLYYKDNKIYYSEN